MRPLPYPLPALVLLGVTLFGQWTMAAGLDGGHVKLRALGSYYPADSLLREPAGRHSADAGADLRLSFSADEGRWGAHADYQLIGVAGDRLRAAGGAIAGPLLTAPALPDDDRRWWGLTRHISGDEGDDSALLQRLDRLYVDYRGRKTVLRFGRQALSWGNGLIYTPMDIFNPFDPAAVDTEYKAGDDMLYGQYLLDSGDDWQLVRVQRRDERGHVSNRVSSTALKYHRFGVQREFDLLLAQHYDETVAAAGGAVNAGASVLRGDITLADTDRGAVASAVASWSYSWVWGGHNVSAVTEYFYNGFGLAKSDYPEALSEPPGRRQQALLTRLERGELYTIGRHYLAASLLLEWTPLLTVTPSLFVNAGDGSALAQLVWQWSLAQNWQLLGALNLPMGSRGTEYGGLDTGLDGRTLAPGASAFVQLAWYFQRRN